jgi:putative colanic acid biosynthesis glycosyltransferase
MLTIWGMTINSPFFSIITITKDNLSGLKQTAQSLVGQTCNDYEWIVIDGNSNYGTQSWLKESRASLWISEPDTGIYNAMNKGIEKAKGQYLFFLNAGDECGNQYILGSIKSCAQETSADFIYGDSFESTPHGVRYKKARAPYPLAFGMFTHHQAMLYRREALGRMRYDESFKIAGDYDLTIRFLKEKPKIAYLQKPLCIFAYGGVSQKQAKLGRTEQYHSKLKHRICKKPMAVLVYWIQTLRFALKGLRQ